MVSTINQHLEQALHNKLDSLHEKIDRLAALFVQPAPEPDHPLEGDEHEIDHDGDEHHAKHKARKR